MEDERELIDHARLGNRGAFDALMENSLPRIWGVVWRILRHQQDTEDVVQEVYLAAWRALPAFRGESQFTTWLYKIAVTRAINHLDRAGERGRRSALPLDTLGTGEVGLEPRSTSADPLQHLEGRELLRRLALCLPRLPGGWRAVVSLRDGEGLNYTEIAEVLGLPLGTVRSRLARARQALKDCIEGVSA